MAMTLGLEEDYFIRDSHEAPVVAITTSGTRIPRLKVNDAARLMGVSEKVITRGLRDGIFPWGYAVQGRGEKYVYFINAKKFAEIEGVAI